MTMGRGGDNGAQHRGGSGNGAGEVVIVAHFPHGLDLDVAQAAGIGNGSAAHTGEQGGAQHVGVAHAAGDGAHDHIGEAEHLPGNAAGVHQVAHEDEEGGGDHGEGVRGLGDPLDNHHGVGAGEEHIQEGCQAQVDIQGQSRKQQDQKQYQDDCNDAHSSSPPTSL